MTEILRFISGSIIDPEKHANHKNSERTILDSSKNALCVECAIDMLSEQDLSISRYTSIMQDLSKVR